MIKAKLIVVGGDLEDGEVFLTTPTVFGRGRETDVTLSHPLVSRNHCEITERDGDLIVRDLASMNGTFVGSERITESILRHGDLLTVGTVTFRVVNESEELTTDEIAVTSASEGTLTEFQKGNETIRVDKRTDGWDRHFQHEVGSAAE